MKKYYISFLLFIICLLLSAQTWNWAHTFGSSDSDVLWDLAVTPDGETVMVGYFEGTLQIGALTVGTSAGNYDFFVAKFDIDGFPMWAVHGGGLELDQAKGVAIADDGTVYVSGSFEGEITFADSTYYGIGVNSNCFIASLSSQGDLQWFQHFAGTGPEDFYPAYGNSIAVADDGRIAMAGRMWKRLTVGAITLESSYYGDAFVIILNPDGTVNHAFNTDTSYDGRGYGVDFDAAGNVYLCGDYKGSIAFPDGTHPCTDDREDVFIASWDASGVYRWSDVITGTGENVSWRLAVDAAGNCYTISDFYYYATVGDTTLACPSPGYDICLTKHTTDGELQWVKQGTAYGNQRAHGITLADGVCYITGYAADALSLDDFSINCMMLDAFVAAISADGYVENLIGITGTNAEKGTGIAFYDGAVILGGTFQNQIILNNNPINAVGANDFFLTSMSLDCELGSVEGYVTNSQTGSAIADAMVILDGSTCITDETGYFSISKSQGEYAIAVVKPGFTPAQGGTVMIFSGQMITHDLTITPFQTALRAPQNVTIVPSGNNAASINWQGCDASDYDELGYDDWTVDEWGYVPVTSFDTSLIAQTFSLPQAGNLEAVKFLVHTPYYTQEQDVNAYVFGCSGLYPDFAQQLADPITITLADSYEPQWVEVPVGISLDACENFTVAIEWTLENNFYLGADSANPDNFAFSSCNSGDNWMVWGDHDFMIHPIITYGTTDYRVKQPVSVASARELPCFSLDAFRALAGYEHGTFPHYDATALRSTPAATCYEIMRNNQVMATITHVGGQSAYSYLDAMLVPGLYSYQLRAVYDQGHSAWTVPIECMCTPPVLAAPYSLEGSISNQTANLSWLCDPGLGNWLHHDTGICADAIGTGSVDSFDSAIRFTPADLQGYSASILSSLRFVPCEQECQYTLRVWQGGSPYDPGSLIYEQMVPNPEILQWNTVRLNTPIAINASEELWLGVHMESQTGYPAGVDEGPMVPGKGAWICSGGEWSTLMDLGGTMNYNWSIQALLVEPSGTEERVLHVPLVQDASGPTRQRNTAVNADYSRAALMHSVAAETREISGMKVYRDGSCIADLDAAARSYTDHDAPGGTVEYYVIALYDEGESTPSNTVELTINPSSSGAQVPQAGGSLYNFPNPFKSQTEICFTGVETRSIEYAEIEIYDARGRVIKTLTVTDDMLRSDGAVIRWDGTDAAGKRVCSGIYFYRLSLDGTNYIQSKMILLK
jgi:hypothetical protein